MTNVPKWMTDVYEVWYRDLCKITHSMLGNPDFKGHFDVAPFQEFTRSREWQYSNLMSGNWAWRLAVHVVHV